jgi:hypothetical protein
MPARERIHIEVKAPKSKEHLHPSLYLTPPDEMLTIIGRITIYWSRIMQLMDEGIRRLSKMGMTTSFAVTVVFKYSGKLDMLQALATHKFEKKPAALAAYKAINTRIRNCYAARNAIEHGFWLHIPGQTLTVRAHPMNVPMKKITLDDLNKVVSDLESLYADFYSFLMKHAALPPSQRKRFLQRAQPPTDRGGGPKQSNKR